MSVNISSSRGTRGEVPEGGWGVRGGMIGWGVCGCTPFRLRRTPPRFTIDRLMAMFDRLDQDVEVTVSVQPKAA